MSNKEGTFQSYQIITWFATKYYLQELYLQEYDKFPFSHQGPTNEEISVIASTVLRTVIQSVIRMDRQSPLIVS